MKAVILSLSILISSCNCMKDSNENSDLKEAKTILTSNCPEDGVCRLEIYKNKTIQLKKDGIGKLYYNLIDSESKSVVYFEYSRNVPKDLQDASYREEIVFEIDNNSTSQNLLNTDLKNVKMLFGKHCFCRSEAGYYNVNNGNLNYNYINNELKFNLTFKIPEVSSQVITSISSEN